MKSSLFIIQMGADGKIKEIKNLGEYHDNYLTPALKNGKIVHQTQSNPDSNGNVIITIGVEHS